MKNNYGENAKTEKITYYLSGGSMKKGLLVVAVCFFTLFSAAKEPPKGKILQIGDSLNSFIKEYPPKSYQKIEDKSGWVEFGQMAYFFYKKEFDSRFPTFMVWNKSVPFGVLQGEPPDAYFLYDTDGDSILDYKTTHFFFPFFLVEANSPNLDPKNLDIKKTLDVFYNTFQSNEGPYESEVFKNALKNDFTPFLKDTNKPDRDLFFLLAQYTIHTNTPDLAIMIGKELRKRYYERYGAMHPVIVLYLLESCINKGDKDAARNYCQELRELAPDFIPALVYEADLSQDPTKAAEIRAQLKKDHPAHWIVKVIK